MTLRLVIVIKSAATSLGSLVPNIMDNSFVVLKLKKKKKQNKTLLVLKVAYSKMIDMINKTFDLCPLFSSDNCLYYIMLHQYLNFTSVIWTAEGSIHHLFITERVFLLVFLKLLGTFSALFGPA